MLNSPVPHHHITIPRTKRRCTIATCDSSSSSRPLPDDPAFFNTCTPNAAELALGAGIRLTRLLTSNSNTCFSDIAEFIQIVQTNAEFHPATICVAFVFLVRFLSKTNLNFTDKNWRSLTAVALQVANKTFDDLSPYNYDFLLCIDANNNFGWCLASFNRWERLFVAGLGYDVNITMPLYTTVFFQLRDEAFLRVKEWQDDTPKRSD